MSHSLRRGLSVLASIVFFTSCASTKGLVFDGVVTDDVGTGEVAADAFTPDTIDPIESASVADGEAPGDAPSGAVGDATQTGVESAFTRLITRWTDCLHRPARCEVGRITAPDSPERKRLTESLDFYVTENIRTKPDEGRLQWSIESLTIPSKDRARLMTCEYDTRIFFDASMADTEFGDIIFDTTVWTRRVEWTLARSGDSWTLWSRRIERRSPVARFCTP
ncbi:MAG: hypothetical protein RL072_203 [Actinomycetota bacterium]